MQAPSNTVTADALGHQIATLDHAISRLNGQILIQKAELRAAELQVEGSRTLGESEQHMAELAIRVARARASLLESESTLARSLATKETLEAELKNLRQAAGRRSGN